MGKAQEIGDKHEAMPTTKRGFMKGKRENQLHAGLDKNIQKISI